MSSLFSPSLKLRREPPNSLATVMYTDGVTAVMKFRGRTLIANVLDQDEEDPVTAGETLCLLEHPRGIFHVKRDGFSWYANPLENWITKGKRACATLEYFLRKNRKFTPLFLGDDGKLKIKDPSEEEVNLPTWPTGGGGLGVGRDGGTDGGGGGVSSEDEYNATLPVWITVTPTYKSSGGLATVRWGSLGEASVTVTGSNGESWSGTSGEQNVTISSTSRFIARGASGAEDCAICAVSSSFATYTPAWIVFKPKDFPCAVQIEDYDWSDHFNVSGTSIGFDIFVGIGSDFTILPITLEGWKTTKTTYKDLIDRGGSSAALIYSIDTDQIPNAPFIDEYKKMVGWWDGTCHRRKISIALNGTSTEVIPTPATIAS